MSVIEVNDKIRFDWSPFPTQCGARIFHGIRSRKGTEDSFYQGYNAKRCYCPRAKTTRKAAYGEVARKMMGITLRNWEGSKQQGRHIIFSDRSDYNAHGAISWIGLAEWLGLKATTVSINPSSNQEIKTFVVTHKKFNELYKKAMKQ